MLMHMNLVCVLDMQSYLCSMLPRTNHYRNIHMFYDKYMKFFDAYLNAICTFGLRIKRFLTASNTDFSDILETPSYFVLPPWCITPPKIVLDLVQLKKDCTDASIYQQLFMEIQDWYMIIFLFTQMGSRDGNFYEMHI